MRNMPEVVMRIVEPTLPRYGSDLGIFGKRHGSVWVLRF